MCDKKVCNQCDIDKPLDEFSNNSSRKDGKSGKCKECTKLNYKNKQLVENPEYHSKKIANEEAFLRGNKICKKCDEEKSLDEFHNSKKFKDGKHNNCKSCRNADNVEYNKNTKEKHSARAEQNREANKDKLKTCINCEEVKPMSEFHNCGKREDGKKSQCKVCRKKDRDEFYLNNRERTLEQQREYRKNNPETEQERHRIYRENNIEKEQERQRKYKAKNKDRINIRDNNYIKQRRESNPLFKLTCNIRNAIRQSYSKKGYTKNSKTQEILTCDFKTFEQHLNNNLYGFTIDDTGLDLDHIIPTSSATTEEELIALNHYTNFQLLPSVYNRDMKSDKPWDKEDFENWLSENYSW
jgi:hypothetical protein